MPARILAAIAVFTLTPLSFGASLDFTAQSFWNAGFTGTVDGVAVTLTGNGGTMTTNTGAGEIAGCNAASGLICDGDGIGIRNDETSGGANPAQSLTLNFNSPVNVNSISFLDLFQEGPTETVSIEASYAYGGGTNLFTAYAGTSAGGFLEWTAGGNLNGVDEVSFYPGNLSSNDFALAAINVSAVPLPAAAWLFGSALLGLTAVARRRAT